MDKDEKPTENAITPPMIEAGVRAFYDNLTTDIPGRQDAEETVREIFTAMARLERS
jgi:hypothetical protein